MFWKWIDAYQNKNCEMNLCTRAISQIKYCDYIFQIDIGLCKQGKFNPKLLIFIALNGKMARLFVRCYLIL